MRKVLIANRGEIAVRIVRACRDAEIVSVAVYAEPDLEALHVRMADEAYALGGSTAGDSYLRIDKILEAAEKAGAEGVHPGYGFLAENADFAEAVIGAGMRWIGPPPDAIRRLGDKTQARHIALAVGAPLAPGTADPVTGVDEVLAFAESYGTPIAIKAAFGGGGRGIKVARSMDEVAALYESAVREATAAFGRGECFVERFLDRPRHVETQVLADKFGKVVVVGTRDCSLQRRYQKLVEESPAPFLTAQQHDSLYSASKALCKAAGYVGAGTVEFLVAADGTVSFLEVNTRLQVEHPVTEETAGIDLVREQFRIADGQRLDFDDPEPRGHAIEFRINGEDPGRDFLPSPGTVTRFVTPTGPGVRVDAGVEAGSVISGAFDSLLAKVIVHGRTRREAIERSRRALDEMVVAGLPTVLPFHQVLLREADFTDEPFRVHNRWIETEFTNTIPPFVAGAEAAQAPEAGERESLTVEVAGRRIEVVLPGGLVTGAGAGGRDARATAPRRRGGGRSATVVSGDAVTSPMQGTIVKVAVDEGTVVAAGDTIVVLEAMKMEQPITAHKSGAVAGLHAKIGDVVTSGAVLCEIRD
ncbi:MAG: acetyl/propionyl/methylcrotonyl-CoA carboxylase subunit alpha [Frankiaceae bacterium]